MADPQHIVERIRAFMGATDQIRVPDLSELADSYATLCTDANARLRRCRDYLRRGLRAEAIHEADEAPVLLDLVALLDIPEARDWSRACGAYEIQRPPPLLIDAAQELNDAYAAAQPLRTLLEKHRRLALQRAPLNQRIAVMRDLAKTDPGTPFWSEDLQTFELSRLRELNNEAVVAARASDRPTIARLREEVESSAWRVSVPDDLRTLLDRTELAWRRQDAEVEIRQLLPELNTAYSAMDYDVAATTLRQLRHIIADSQIALPDEISAQIVPVREWVTAERNRRELHSRFEAACAQLSLAIQADAPTSELERLKREALALEEELPADLSHKLRQVSQQREQARLRQIRRSRTIVGAMVLGCVVIVGLVINTSIRERRVRQAYDTLSPLIGSEKWDEAKKVWDRLAQDTPSAIERPEFKQLRAQIDDAAIREQSRRNAFEAQMKQATARGVETPDLGAINEAQSLASTGEEKLEVSDFRARIDSAHQAAIQKQIEQLKQKLASLGVQANWLESEAREGRVGPTNSTLSATETGIGQIAGSDLATPEIKHDADEMLRRLKTLRETAMRTVAEREAMDVVLHAAGSPSSLREALLAYAAKNPDSPRAVSFKQSADRKQAWEAVEEAAKLIESWDGKLQPLPSGFSKRIDALTAYAAKYGTSPLAASFEEYRSYLSVGQRAIAGDGPWKGELAKLLATPILKDLRSIRTTDGKLYYLTADSTPQSNSLGTTFLVVVTGDLNNTKRVTLKPAQIDNATPADSPQSLLAADLSKKLAALDEGNWETFGFDIIDEILTHRDVDPVLRVILLSKCAKLAQTGTWGADDAIGALDAMVSPLNADDIAWMNPSDGPANQAREKAQAILAKLSPLKQLREAVTTRRETMFKSLRLRVAGHGILMRDNDNWKVIPMARVEAGEEAWTVAVDNGRLSLSKIGTVDKDGKFAMDATAVRNVSEGAMVFIVPR